MKFLALIKLLAFLQKFFVNQIQPGFAFITKSGGTKGTESARNFMYVKNLMQSQFDMSKKFHEKRKKFHEDARNLKSARNLINARNLKRANFMKTQEIS